MTLKDRIAHQTQIVYQRCSRCGGELKRLEVIDHKGVCWMCRKEVRK